MSYRIQRDPNTSLWIVLFEGINLRSLVNGNILSRAAEPLVAINLARDRVQQLNDPVTGVGPGTIPPLTPAIQQQLLAQAASIEQQEREQFEKSRNDQGPGTVSTGVTTAEAAAARDNQATTQAPPVSAQSASATGEVSTTSATTLPSNAAPGQPPTPTATAAPSKLPEGQVSATPGTAAQVPAAQGSQGPVAAQQTGGANLDTPDENTNQVSYIYLAYQVTSNFRQGRFTQELQGAQIFFPLQPQQQENPNAVRSAPDQSAAETARLARQAASVPQGTVAQSVATPGATFTQRQVKAGENIRAARRSQLGIGDPLTVTDTFSAEGFGDFGAQGISVVDQTPVTAPLASVPPTTGIADGASISPVPLAVASGSATGTQVLASERSRLITQLGTERNTLARLQAALASLQAQGVPAVRTAAAQSAIDQKQRQISGLETRLAQVEIDIQRANQANIRPNTNVAPQTGAKES